MARQTRKSSLVRNLINPWRILIPVCIGLGVSAYQIAGEVQAGGIQAIEWGGKVWSFLLLSMLMMLVRDVAYIIRIKLLSGGELTWNQAIQGIFMWEFASAITPSVVGGAPIAIMILNREGISWGKSAAMVMVTALLDELFFVAMVPIVLAFAPSDALFPIAQLEILNTSIGPKDALWVSYGLIALYCVFMFLAIFIAPRQVKRLLMRIFSMKWLLRWRRGMARFGQDLENASRYFRTKTLGFWLKNTAATFLSWTGRYMVINCLITAITVQPDQWLIYARQLVMWVILLISVTPGGSGFAEVAFDQFFNDTLPEGTTGTIGMLWRLISYWIYILIGILLLPRWIRRVYLKRKLIKFKG